MMRQSWEVAQLSAECQDHWKLMWMRLAVARLAAEHPARWKLVQQQLEHAVKLV
jgi:hypothetical protein